MDVCDQIFDTDDYRLAISNQISPVVGVVAGTGQEESALTATVKQLSNLGFQSSNKIIFTPVRAVEHLEKKKDKPSDHYTHNYQVRGILKRDWVRRHQSVMFGCVALLFDWDAADTKDRLAFEQLVLGKVEKVRQRLRGMTSRLLLVMATNRGSTQAAPASGGYLGFEDALLNVRSRCGLDDKSIAVLHNGDTKSASRVHRCAFELCMRYHRDETSRIKKFKSDLSKTTNHSAMTARHRFKVGFNAELSQDTKLKKRNYDKSYAACRQLATGSNLSGLEVRVVSSIILHRNMTCMLACSSSEADQLFRTFQEHVKWLQPPSSTVAGTPAAKAITTVPHGSQSDEACSTSLSFPVGSFDSKEEEHAAYIISQWVLSELYTAFSEAMSKIHNADHLRGLSGLTGRRVFAQPGMPGFNTLACAETLRSLRDERAKLITALSTDPSWASSYRRSPAAHSDNDDDEDDENGDSKKLSNTLTKEHQLQQLPDVEPPEFFGQEYRHCNSTKLLVRHLLATPTMSEVSAQSAKMFTKAYNHYKEMGLHSRCYTVTLSLAEHFLVIKDYAAAFKQLVGLICPSGAGSLTSDGTGGGMQQMLTKWPQMGTTVREMFVRAIIEGKLYESNLEHLCHGVRSLLMLMATLPELPSSSAPTREDATTKIVESYSRYTQQLQVLLSHLDEENPDKVILVDERQGKGIPTTAIAATNTLGTGGDSSLVNRGLYSKILLVTCSFDRAYVEAESTEPLQYTVEFTSQIPMEGLPVSDLTLLFATDGKDESNADFVVSVPVSRGKLSRGSRSLRHSGELRLKKPGIIECVGAMATVMECTVFFKVDTIPARRRLLESRGMAQLSPEGNTMYLGGGKYDHSLDHSAIPDVYLPHRPAALIIRPVPKVQVLQISGTTAKSHAVEGEDYQVQVKVESLGDTILPGAKLLVGCYPGVLELIGGIPADKGSVSPAPERKGSASPYRVTSPSPSPTSATKSLTSPTTTAAAGASVDPSDIYVEEINYVQLPDAPLRSGESTTLTLPLRCLRAGKLQINLKLEFETDSRNQEGKEGTLLPLASHSKLMLHVCHPVFVYFTLADTTVWDLKKAGSRDSASTAGGNTALSHQFSSTASPPPAAAAHSPEDAAAATPKVYLAYDGTSGLFVESPEMRADQFNSMSVVRCPTLIEPSIYVEIDGVTDPVSLEDGNSSHGGSFAGLHSIAPAASGAIISGRGRSETTTVNPRDSAPLGPPPAHALQFYTAQQSQLPTETQRMSLPLNLRTNVPFMVSCRFVNSMQFPLVLHRLFLAVQDQEMTTVLSEQEPEGLLPCTIGVDEEYTFTVMLQHAGEGQKVELGSAVLELSRGLLDDDALNLSVVGKQDAAMDQVFGGGSSPTPTSPATQLQRLEHQLPLPTANFVSTPVIVSFEYPQEVQVNKPFPLVCKVKSLSDRVQEVEVCLAPMAGAGNGMPSNMSLSGIAGQPFLMGGRTAWNVTLPPLREKTTTFKVVPTMSGFLSLPSFMGLCQEGNVFILWPDERRTINVVPKPMEEFLA